MRAGRGWRIGGLSIYLEPRDGWFGVFDNGREVFLCPVPFVVFRYWHPGPVAAWLAGVTLLVGFLVPEPVGSVAQLYPFMLTLLAGWQCWRRFLKRRRYERARRVAEQIGNEVRP